MQEGPVFIVLGAKYVLAGRYASCQVVDQGKIGLRWPGKQDGGYIQPGDHFFEERLPRGGAIPYNVSIQAAD